MAMATAASAGASASASGAARCLPRGAEATAAGAGAGVPKVGVLGGAFPVTNDDFMARLAALGGNAADPDRVVMWADLEMPRCSVDPEGCYVSMLRGTKALRDEHGCTHVCFPCCTAHQWFDKLSEDVPELETIHMVNKTIEKCESDGRKPLGLLATTLTVKMELWGKEMVIPTETTQARIQEAVESVGTGKTGVLADGTKAVEVLAAAARELEAAGAQAIVLGCTDIGTYCPRDACGVPLVDAMDSLSVAIAECVA